MSKYKWVLPETVSIDMVTMDGIYFLSDWILIDNGVLTIKKGYAWDGSSPKLFIGKYIIGTWDGPTGSNGHQKAYMASLAHDALYQYLNELIVVGYSRMSADLEFKRLLDREHFLLSNPYYYAVRIFGGLFV